MLVDIVSTDGARTVTGLRGLAFEHYDDIHPHKALKMMSPRMFRWHRVSGDIGATPASHFRFLMDTELHYERDTAGNSRKYSKKGDAKMEDKKTPRRLVLLIDYRRQFYSSTRSRGACMDVEKLGRVFEADGYVVEVIQFADIDFRARSFAGNVVLYQSAEDPGLRYKQYIEDLLLGLRFQGAYLVPSFEAFRAHHNKVFMEILRDLTCVNEIRTVRSRSFGTLQELRARADAIRYPATVKPCQGSKGQNISIVGSREELLHAAARVSRSLTWDNLQFYIYHLWDGNGFLPMSNHRERFVVQDTIPSLAGDYKVLAYWDRFFVLYRRNRHGVPIASGSKRFDYITIVPDKVLDLATLVLRSFASPYGSFDIALSNGVPHLLEFQFVCFGQRALESSTGYFHQVQGRWVRVEATSTLEEEFARAVNCYIHERAGAD